MSKKRRWEGRIYLGRDENGKQIFHWVGRFATRRERDDAVAEERIRIKRGGPLELPTCDEYVTRYLAEYERRHRGSSHDTQTQRLARFSKDFEGRSLDIPRAELKDWRDGEGPWGHRPPIKEGEAAAVVSLYNHAIDDDDLPLPKNPARKFSRRSKGRAEDPPPTEEEFQALLEACAVHGKYAPMMRAIFLFATYTLLRPSEIYGLEWTDIDFESMRIGKIRRVYRGAVDDPKTGKKTIALTPPARDAIIGLPRTSKLVFTSKRGKRLSQSGMSGYWGKVTARAGLDFEFYHATKHYGVHYMWTKLGMSNRAIAAQAGWSTREVDRMLAIYGHGDVGALEEVDAAFQDAQVTPLRAVE